LASYHTFLDIPVQRHGENPAQPSMVVAMTSGGINLATISMANFMGLLMATTLKMLFLGGLSPLLLIAYAFILSRRPGLWRLARHRNWRTHCAHRCLIDSSDTRYGDTSRGTTLVLTGGTVVSQFPEPVVWIGVGAICGLQCHLFFPVAVRVISRWNIDN
jgi:hypothetical protein